MNQYKDIHPELHEELAAIEFDKRILKIIEDAEIAISKSYQALQKIKAAIEGGSSQCDL